MGVGIRRGLWIPPEILHDETLGWSEKALLSVIKSLSKDPSRGCFASNDYLANCLGQTIGSVKNLITKLKKSGHIAQLSGTRNPCRSLVAKIQTNPSNRHKNM